MVRVLLGCVALASACTDDPMLDLCDSSTTAPATGTTAPAAVTTAPVVPAGATTGMDEEVTEDGARYTFGTPWLSLSLALAGFGGRGFILPALIGEAAGAAVSTESSCSQLKEVYKSNECCGNPDKVLEDTQIVPVSTSYRTSNKVVGSTNPCENAQQDLYLKNEKCFIDSVVDAVEASFADVAVGPQSGADVTQGFVGEYNVSTMMDGSGITVNKFPFRDGAGTEDGAAGLGPLCPVNVHWHLGAEHKSGGQYDEAGKSPSPNNQDYTASADAPVRYGFACHHYDASDSKFTTPYEWKHCVDMKVGETYEVHWPHSVLGACGTPHQYQTKFYDGLFCRYAKANSPALTAQQIASNVGVQAQVFTIVNDEDYYYPDLMKGMIVSDGGDQKFGKDLAIYAGSSTGTTRDDMTCSAYSPVTWQVDRTCHLISASSFDKMCADMKQNHDPMDNDLHPHGARKVVAKALNSDEVHSYNHAGDDEQTIPR